MLQQVIEYGSEIHRKHELYNFTQFERKLVELEKIETEKFRGETEKTLQEKNEECDIFCKKHEEKLISEVNKILFEEARRIRTKEWLKNQYDHRKSSSKGKRELEKSLKSAKETFFLEKTDAIQNTLDHLNRKAEKSERLLLEAHAKTINDINFKFNEKFKEQEKNRHNKKEAALGRISNELSVYKRELASQRMRVLNEKKRSLQLKQDFLRREYQVEKEKNDVVKDIICGQETKEKYMLLSRKHILDTFKQFVRATNNGDETKINDFLDMASVT